MHTEAGRELLLDLARAATIHHGDALLAEDGSLIAVEALPEPVLDVTAESETLVRIVWHIGNRHVPVQFLPGRLRLRQDHVLAAMIERIGGTVAVLDAPFDPEPGAYHGHDHGHDDQ